MQELIDLFIVIWLRSIQYSALREWESGLVKETVTADDMQSWHLRGVKLWDEMPWVA